MNVIKWTSMPLVLRFLGRFITTIRVLSQIQSITMPDHISYMTCCVENVYDCIMCIYWHSSYLIICIFDGAHVLVYWSIVISGVFWCSNRKCGLYIPANKAWVFCIIVHVVLYNCKSTFLYCYHNQYLKPDVLQFILFSTRFARSV